MEFTYYLPPFTSLILLVSIIIITIVIFVPRIKPQPEDPKLPPGPWQLPIIGSLHHLRSSLPPHRTLRELSKIYGPDLMHLKFGSVPYVIVSSPEAAKEILKTHDTNFANRSLFAAIKIITYNGKGIIFAPYGEEYQQVRKICTLEMLTPKRVHSFTSIRVEEVDALIKSISYSSDGSVAVNLSKMLLLTMNNVTSRTVFGNKCKQQAEYLEVLPELIKLAGGFDMADIFPSVSWLIGLLSGSRKKIERCHRKHERILEEIIEEHREKRRGDGRGGEEDFVDVLMRHQEDGDLQFELTTEWVKALIADLFAAGSESSSTITVWTMTELLRHPRVMKKVQEEVREALRGKPKVAAEAEIKNLYYMQLVIKEAIRLHIPSPLLIPRECKNTCELLGYKIPKNTRVIVNVWAIARDPQYWEDSEDFRPERFEGNPIDFKGTSFEFLPFGAGRRMCPGMLFGLSNVELTLAQLLYHFNWALPKGIEPNGVDMNETFGATARKRDDLCLHAIPQISCHKA